MEEESRNFRDCNAWNFLYKSLQNGKIKNGRHLDYGAHDGKLINFLCNSKLLRSAVGLELSGEALLKQNILHKNVKLYKINKRPKIKNEFGLFDSISILGVIEHIADQNYILRELHGALRDNGVLVVAVPGKHLFSFLDFGNWKFVFPKLHRLFFEKKIGKKEYNIKYIDNPDGLIGDIEKEKSWHEHFSRTEISVLLENNNFEVIEIGGAGFFMRPLRNIRYFLPQKLKKYIDILVKLDEEKFSSAELWVLARKIKNISHDSISS